MVQSSLLNKGELDKLGVDASELHKVWTRAVCLPASSDPASKLSR